MDCENVLEILGNSEMTQDQIADMMIGKYSTSDNSKSGYLKIGAQILVENELEFLLNEMVDNNKLGIKKIQNGLLEHVYYYVKNGC
jgi:hypothetical protein